MEIELLIEECKKQNILAQRLLYEKFCTQLFNCCKRYIQNNEDAEECLMNGFHIIYKSIHKFSYINDSSFVGWLRRIVINECLNFLRKKNRFDFTQIENDDLISVEPTVFENIESRDLLKIIEQMPIGYKTILNLYVVEQMSHKEISELLNITEGTSKSQLSRARVNLKNLILKRNEYAKRKGI